MTTTPGEQRQPQVSIEALRENGMRIDAEEAFRAAVDAVEPSRLVVRAFQGLPSALKTAVQMRKGRLAVIGAGKAAAGMCSALEDVLAEVKVMKGDTPPPPLEGLCVVKRGARGTERLRRVRVLEAAHPVPDASSVAAGRAMLDLVRGLTNRDLAFGAFSGGASALIATPSDDVTIGDLQATTELLLKAGATIHEMNAIRKHLSAIGGGQLARASAAAAFISLVISDVPGDKIDSIASGPTVADDSTFREAFAALRRYDLLEEVPASVRSRLELGARGKIPETPKHGDLALARTRTMLIGSNRTALEAAADRCNERGFPPVIVPGALSGDARAAGELLGRRLLQLKEKAPKAVVIGGETTVKVAGSGKGGRSQEVALAAARVISGYAGICVLAGGTDGEDGPTDAAGAVVDGSTIAEAKVLGLDPDAALANNDAYPFFERLGRLVKTGPTGTNVMDVAIGLILART